MIIHPPFGWSGVSERGVPRWIEMETEQKREPRWMDPRIEPFGLRALF